MPDLTQRTVALAPARIRTHEKLVVSPPASDLATDWRTNASCGPSKSEELFAMGADQHIAKTICERCPVRTECLAMALDNKIEFGVWGGMTERERRVLLRRRPGVSSWFQLLTAARDQHDRLLQAGCAGPSATKGLLASPTAPCCCPNSL